jgi:N-acetylglucosamine-6-phosphate deacetylase
MMTATPARIMGVQGSKGTVASGMDADITICDEQFNVKAVLVMGEILYKEKHFDTAI